MKNNVKQRKPLLEEKTMRRWSRLAGSTLTEDFIGGLFEKDEEPEEEEEGAEMAPPDASAPPAPEGEVSDMGGMGEPGMEEPSAASSMPEEDREDILVDVVKAVAAELGIEADVSAEGGEGEEGMEDELPPEEGEEMAPEGEGAEGGMPSMGDEGSEEEEKPLEETSMASGAVQGGAKPVVEAKKVWPAKDPAAGAKWSKGKKVTQESVVARVVERVIRRLVAEAKANKAKPVVPAAKSVVKPAVKR